MKSSAFKKLSIEMCTYMGQSKKGLFLGSPNNLLQAQVKQLTKPIYIQSFFHKLPQKHKQFQFSYPELVGLSFECFDAIFLLRVRSTSKVVNPSDRLVINLRNYRYSFFRHAVLSAHDDSNTDNNENQTGRLMYLLCKPEKTEKEDIQKEIAQETDPRWPQNQGS